MDKRNDLIIKTILFVTVSNLPPLSIFGVLTFNKKHVRIA